MVHRRYRARASNLACVIPRMKGSVCFCGMTVLNAELKCACGDPQVLPHTVQGQGNSTVSNITHIANCFVVNMLMFYIRLLPV